jgi:hypothetical protein
MKIIRMISLHITCFFIGLVCALWSILKNTEGREYRDENGPILKIGNGWKGN